MEATGVTNREVERKRGLALAAARRAGADVFVVSTPPTVRWLLCGRGRPVDVGGSDYRLVLRGDAAFVLHADIEDSRAAAEERLEELGLERVTYPWHEGPDATVARLAGAARRGSDAELEEDLRVHRLELDEAERERYRAAGSAAAAAFEAAIQRLGPELTELDAAAELAAEARRRDLVPRVLLVGGEERQPVHRHPLPTRAPLGRHALLALTAEREGLHVSLTRIVSFGPARERLRELVRASAEVDAAMLAASRPGATVGGVLDVAVRAYAERGFPEEWRRHHQGGPTGYRGREVFAVPGEPTPLPASCAVAWNPSITGGGKSEDTVLVSEEGLEVVTRTPGLPEVEVGGLVRPWIVEL